jgi:hypothetical protein
VGHIRWIFSFAEFYLYGWARNWTINHIFKKTKILITWFIKLLFYIDWNLNYYCGIKAHTNIRSWASDRKWSNMDRYLKLLLILTTVEYFPKVEKLWLSASLQLKQWHNWHHFNTNYIFIFFLFNQNDIN